MTTNTNTNKQNPLHTARRLLIARLTETHPNAPAVYKYVIKTNDAAVGEAAGKIAAALGVNWQHDAERDARDIFCRILYSDDDRNGGALVYGDDYIIRHDGAVLMTHATAARAVIRFNAPTAALQAISSPRWAYIIPAQDTTK